MKTKQKQKQNKNKTKTKQNKNKQTKIIYKYVNILLINMIYPYTISFNAILNLPSL